MCRVFLLIALLLAGAGFLGCDDDDCVVAPSLSGGRIEGYVSDGGPWLDGVEVDYKSHSGSNHSFAMSAECDSTGYYRMNVPPGSAYLRVDPPYPSRYSYFSSAGYVEEQAQADTLDIAMGTVRADFNLGRAHVALVLPEGIEMKDPRLAIGTGTYSDIHQDAVINGDTLSFTFRMICPESYNMYLSQSGIDGRASLSTLSGLGDEGVLDILEGEDTQLTLSLPEPVVLSGTISGSWQELNSDNPRVYIHSSEEDWLYAFYVEDNGQFFFQAFTNQLVRICVGIGAYRNWIGGTDYASATVFDLSSGEDFTGISHVESGIRCDITNADEFLITDNVICLYDASGEFMSNFGCTWNGDSDNLIVSNLDPGIYFLQIAPALNSVCWLPRYYGGSRTLEDAEPITVTGGGQVTYINMALTRGGEIRGRLIHEDGGSYFPVTPSFWLAPADGELTEAYFVWDKQFNNLTGEFSFVQLEDGGYRIGVRLNNESVSWYPGVEGLNEADEFMINDHDIIEDIEWTINPAVR
jgi:hypothetical protein